MTPGSLIGAVVALVAIRIPIDFALGLPISFYYAGLLPNDERHRSSRLIALACAPILVAAGAYLVWLSWQK